VPYSLKMNGLQGVLSDIRQTVLGKGIACDVDIHNVDEKAMEEQKVVMIYRIIQEVVNNAIKHSGASHMLIQLVGHENGLNVMIEDNGRGFDVNQLLQGKGLGLKSIESRVKYLEGSLNIDSTPNQGTTINIEIPLSKSKLG
jgi:two-component system, NarL family, sensor kinase